MSCDGIPADVLVSLGECKDVMTRYLACMKRVKGMNDPECRNIAKSYLACRMDRLASLRGLKRPPAIHMLISWFWLQEPDGER